LETKRLDLTGAQEIAGFKPQDQWPDGTEIVTGQRWED